MIAFKKTMLYFKTNICFVMGIKDRTWTSKKGMTIEGKKERQKIKKEKKKDTEKEREREMSNIYN